MSESEIEFHRLEDYDYSKDYDLSVVCSFKTERFGYLQVRMKRTQNKYQGEVINNWKFETLKNEPDFNMFSKGYVRELEKKTRIVWRMVYDTPAAKQRFDRKP